MQLQATPGRDFPFYDGRPVAISPAGWVLVLAGCALGFAALMLAPTLPVGPLNRVLGVAIFLLAPLAALAAASRGRWSAIFHRPTWRDVRIGVAFAPLTLLVSVAVALLVTRFSVAAANPVVGMLADFKGLQLAGFIALTAPQLLGEELITLLPFLAILSGLAAVGAPRRWAIGGAWVATALLFGALHISTYGGHVGQALAIIGAARLALTGAYVLTRNVWTSFITHLTHDWSLFAVLLAVRAFAG